MNNSNPVSLRSITNLIEAARAALKDEHETSERNRLDIMEAVNVTRTELNTSLAQAKARANEILDVARIDATAVIDAAMRSADERLKVLTETLGDELALRSATLAGLMEEPLPATTDEPAGESMPATGIAQEAA